MRARKAIQDKKRKVAEIFVGGSQEKDQIPFHFLSHFSFLMFIQATVAAGPFQSKKTGSSGARPRPRQRKVSRSELAGWYGSREYRNGEADHYGEVINFTKGAQKTLTLAIRTATAQRPGTRGWRKHDFRTKPSPI